jgi:hypothetical protein
MMFYLKQGFLRMYWSRAASKRKINKTLPLCFLLAARRAERHLPFSDMILPIAMNSHNYDLHSIAVHKSPLKNDKTAQKLLKVAMGKRTVIKDHYSCPICPKHYKVFGGPFLIHLMGTNKNGEITDLGHSSFWSTFVSAQTKQQLKDFGHTMATEEIAALLSPAVREASGQINVPAPAPDHPAERGIPQTSDPESSSDDNDDGDENDDAARGNGDKDENDDNNEVHEEDSNVPENNNSGFRQATAPLQARKRATPPPRSRRMIKARRVYSPD